MVKKINLLIIYFFSAIFLTGCVPDIEELTEKTAGIAFIIMLVSILGLKVIPKINEWDFSKRAFNYFITHISIVLIIIMVLAGIAFLFASETFAFLISLTLFISAGYLYKLRYEYDDKTKEQRDNDLKLWLVTIPTVIVLVFLFLGGFAAILK